MNIRQTTSFLLTAILIVFSGWSVLQTERPVPNTQQDESTYYRHRPSPECPPEKFQQQVLTGLHLVNPQKTGVTTADLSDRVQHQYRAGFIDLFQQQPHWLKSYLRHNYPSHNFW